MLLPKGLAAAALLLSGVQAGVPRLLPRFAARDVDTNTDTTPEPTTTTTRFPLPFESTTITEVGSTDTTSLSSLDETTQSTETIIEVDSTTTSTALAENTDTTTAVESTTIDTNLPKTTEATTRAATTTADASLPPNTTFSSPTTDISIGTDGGVTISGVVTVPSASLPTNFQTTGTAGFVGIGPAATNAASSFSDVAAAASSIAANPSPSIEEIRDFQRRAQDEFEDISHIEAQLKQIDLDSLGEDDSHKVEEALAGLAALLAWYSTQLTALAPAVATPALAAGIFVGLAPAFAAAATGDLLANALDEIKDLDNDNDDGDDDDDPTNTEEEPTKTDESTVVSSETATETSTTTSATATCSALPYQLDFPVPGDDDDSSEEMKRSIAGRVQFEQRDTLEKRARGRTPYFGDCNPANPPNFPSNPTAKTLVAAEEKPKAGGQATKNYNADVQKWFDRQVRCEEGLRPSFEKVSDLKIVKDKGDAGLAQYWTVDHAWELKFMTDYFEKQLLPGRRNSAGAKLTCDEFNQIFDECTLNKLVNQAPGPDHAEFVAMQKDLNVFKGAMFKLGGLAEGPFTAVFSGSTIGKIQALQNLGITVDIFNQGAVRALFERTNQRMYNAFQGIDQRVAARSIAISGEAFSFAEVYQNFMSDRLDQGTAEAWAFVETWTRNIGDDLKEMDPEDPRTQQLIQNYDGFKDSPYSDRSHYSFLANRDLAGAGGTAIPFKRDLWLRDDSCPLNQQSTSAESTTEAATSTDQTTTTLSTETTTTEESTVTTDETTTEESTGTTTTEGSTVTTDETNTEESTTTTATEESTETTTTEQSTDTTTAESTTTIDLSTSAISSTATTFSTATISIQSTLEESSTTVSTESGFSTSTRTKINAQTVTTNGMICVLVEGSLHPQCRPISTPTPNPDGTNVHVNKGCILINNSPRCASDAGDISQVYESSYSVASDPDEPYSTVLILSGFDASNDNHLHSTASCQLQARWPADYGDIYFGEDGCLYDSGSNKIFNQCCSAPDSNDSGPATNPYVAPAPPDAEQDHGNHDGSAICSSISKDTCLSAASRYVDDVVYHQYTSTVWPDDTGKDIANMIFPISGPIIEDLFGINYGCTVIWTCDNDYAFSQGMTGKQIKDSMLNIYNRNGAKGCGSTYIDNGCHITVNGCNNCRDAGRSGTIWNPYDVTDGSYGDANDGFPPRR